MCFIVFIAADFKVEKLYKMILKSAQGGGLVRAFWQVLLFLLNVMGIFRNSFVWLVWCILMVRRGVFELFYFIEKFYKGKTITNSVRRGYVLCFGQHNLPVWTGFRILIYFQLILISILKFFRAPTGKFFLVWSRNGVYVISRSTKLDEIKF